jgi:AraC-like DNA-binding protein
MNRFSSVGLPVADRPGAYEAVMRRYFGDEYVDKHLQLDIGEPEAFSATVDPIVLGHVRGGIHTSSVPHRMFLTPGDTISGDLDFYFLNSGEISFAGDKGMIELRSGDMALLRTSDPVSSVSSRMDMIALHIPERLIRCRHGDRPIDINRKLAPARGLGACLNSLLRTAAECNADLSFEDGLILQSSVVDAVLHAASADREPSDSSTREQASKVCLIKRRMLARIHDAELSPQRVAHDAGISVRTLHRLFHASGVTFSDWVREQRLERCWEELTQPSATHRNVAQVAFRWGFSDLTTFNRSFKLRYGACPTTVRSPPP